MGLNNSGKNRFEVSFFGICSILILSLFACGKSESLSETPQIPVEFDPVFAEKEYVLKDGDEKLIYLTKLINNGVTNEEDFKTWILEKIENLVTRKLPYNPAKLIELNYALYHGRYYSASFRVAHYILNHENRNIYEPAYGMASAALTEYYVVRQDQDSIAKYLQIMENQMEQDTTSWFKVAYFGHKAVLSEYQGDYFNAVVNYYHALELIPQEDTYKRFTMHRNLATTYISMDFIKKAEFHANEAIKILPISKIPFEACDLALRPCRAAILRPELTVAAPKYHHCKTKCQNWRHVRSRNPGYRHSATVV